MFIGPNLDFTTFHGALDRSANLPFSFAVQLLGSLFASCTDFACVPAFVPNGKSGV